ncbi:MAG: M50 family metallopeptidase [Candidatus Aenigmatarchaeota archaeon]
MDIYVDTLAFVIISVVVLLDIIKNRKNIKREKILLFRFSNTFTKKLSDFTKKEKHIFNIISLISLIISIPTIVIISYILVSSFLKLQPTIAIVLPSVSGYKYPGPVISVPFFYWIVSIFLIILFHETMHAIIAINNGLEVKRYGIIYLFLIPIGAFVDLDETKLRKSNLKTKIKVYSAGSLGNFLLALISFLIIYSSLYLFNIVIEDWGVYFESTIPESPAEMVNLSGVIYQIDDNRIKNTYDLSSFLLNKTPGDKIKIYTTAGEYELELGEKDNKSFIGINNVKTYFVYKGSKKKVSESFISLFSHLLILFRWVLLLSLGVGLANMLPIVPLDGGLVVRDILIEYFGKKRGEMITKFVSIAFILIILFSFILSSRFPIKVF